VQLAGPTKGTWQAIEMVSDQNRTDLTRQGSRHLIIYWTERERINIASIYQLQVK